MSDPTSRPRATRNTVTALTRGIEILRCFNTQVATLSNTELSQITRIPKPTVTRLATTLVKQGLLRQDPETERFALAAGVVSIARAFLAHLDVREVARPHLHRLAQNLGGSAFLAVADGAEMVVIEVARSRRTALRSHDEVGSRMPLPTSALGRAYYALLARDHPQRHSLVLPELQAAYDAATWETLAQGLRKACEQYAQLGYCLSMGDVNAEIHSIGVPLPVADGEPMALAFSGPAYLWDSTAFAEQVAAPLRQTSLDIARAIGGLRLDRQGDFSPNLIA